MAKKQPVRDHTLAERIGAALTARGKTWADLGRHMKVTRAGYKKWRDGTVPTAENILDIADYLEVNFRWLVREEGPIAPMRHLTDEQSRLLGVFDQLGPQDRQDVLKHADALLYRQAGRSGNKPLLIPIK